MALTGSTARRSRRRFRPISAMVTTAALVLAGLTSVTGTASAAPALWLGTLGTSPLTASAESTAGVKVAMMELNWARYEPQPGVFNTGYESEMKWRLSLLKSAGMKVTLGLGLHFTPDWVKEMPNSRFVDQYGNVSDEANLVFNNDIRTRANQYLARADAALDFSSFWAVRVSSGSRSEMLYPGGGTYWAFDPNAQGGRALPPTMPDNPLPGWKPGTDGQSIEDMRQWTFWYVAALADTARWQATTVRNLGFKGYVEVLTPGVGVYNRKLPTWYADNLPNGILGLGASWGILYWKLAGIPNLVANITSTADGSGGNDSCEAADRDEPVNGPNTLSWGSTRWISRLADEVGIPKVGENPGYSSGTASSYGDTSVNGLMSDVMRVAKSCGYSGVYWAHDDQFYNGTLPLAALTRYAPANAAPPANASAG